MRSRPCLAFTLVCAASYFTLGLPSTPNSNAAVVKKKDGQIIRGEIQGILIQAETGEVNDEAARGYGGLYFRVPGKEIEAIDEVGVHMRPNSYPRYVLVGRKDKPNDIAVLEAFHKIEEAGISGDVFSLMLGAGIAQIDSRKVQTPIKLRLRGEFRMEGKSGKLIPAIEVNTEKGRVSIPVEDIVEFRKIAEKENK